MMWILFSSVAWAEEHVAEAGHGAHGAVEIPWTSISVQAFNLVFLLLVLGWLMRKSVSAHFAQRAQGFRELVDRAENAKLEAEKSHGAVKERLAKLESSADQLAAQARSEANELKSRLMTEAKALTLKLEQEAQRTTAVELEKAKAHLRHELLSQALSASEDNFKRSLGVTEQQALQKEFAQKIEVVGG